MSQALITCSKCKSNDYRIINEHTGEVMCSFCRNMWVVPRISRRISTDIPGFNNSVFDGLGNLGFSQFGNFENLKAGMLEMHNELQEAHSSLLNDLKEEARTQNKANWSSRTETTSSSGGRIHTTTTTTTRDGVTTVVKETTTGTD